MSNITFQFRMNEFGAMELVMDDMDVESNHSSADSSSTDTKPREYFSAFN